jgi:predicted nucleic acid-binding protein
MENQVPQINPLQKYYRQPKIYIRLPSSGNFYPPGSLVKTENGEYPVYAMTAKDELLIKTPDALLNGQSTVDMIQSCVPNIKNAWNLPSIDVDAILVAIRIATYGEKLDVNAFLPGLDEERTYETDLRTILDRLLSVAFDPRIDINETMTVYIRPLTYAEFTQNALKSLEEQKIISIVNNDQISDVEKLSMFSKSFRKITDLTVNIVAQSIDKIVTPEGEVSNPEYISDFINNAEKEFYKKIIDHLEKQKEKFSIPPFKIITSEDERAKGAPNELEIPITMDSSNFFV